MSDSYMKQFAKLAKEYGITRREAAILTVLSARPDSNNKTVHNMISEFESKPVLKEACEILVGLKDFDAASPKAKEAASLLSR